MHKLLIILVILGICPGYALANKAPDTQRVEAILTKKCMDCHSDQTKYPFYASWPIAKQLIQADIKKGKAFFHIEHSILAKDEQDISPVILKKLEYQVANNLMPPWQYKIAHWDKVLNKDEKRTIIDWIARLTGRALEPLPKPEELDIDQAKANLGSKLFHNTRLSGDNTISCATCHDLAKGGTDRLQFSKGIGGALGHMNSPTVYNAVYNFKQFWDGRAESLEAQAHGPVHNPIEMGSNWQEAIAKLKKDGKLVKLFKEVYGINSSKQITGDMIANSIAEFEKTLVTSGSRLDAYLRGDESAIDTEEKEGLELFKIYGCDTCHMGPALGGQSFEKMGVLRDYFQDRANGANGLSKLAIAPEDNGRFNVSKNEADLNKFKVPVLRNIALTYPYFHDGNVESLEEAVRIMAEYQVGRKLQKRDIELLVKFLKTLNDESLI